VLNRDQVTKGLGSISMPREAAPHQELNSVRAQFGKAIAPTSRGPRNAPTRSQGLTAR
jgi:hypothetical protein